MFEGVVCLQSALPSPQSNVSVKMSGAPGSVNQRVAVTLSPSTTVL